MSNSDRGPASIMDGLLRRRTRKIIGNVDQPTTSATIGQLEIDQLLAAAGNAPFHYPCDRIHLNRFNSPVPWRAYKFGTDTKSKLIDVLRSNGDATKVPDMIAACEYLVLVTWLPDSGTVQDREEKDETIFTGTLRNMENIAAASAFVQSLLLVAEETGFQTYWSSGGALRSPKLFSDLNIAQSELLLGAIFFYPQNVVGAEIKPGKLAEQRGTIDNWSEWIV